MQRRIEKHVRSPWRYVVCSLDTRCEKIGAAFGEVSYTGVASAVARVRMRQRQDASFQQTLLQLEQALEDKKN